MARALVVIEVTDMPVHCSSCMVIAAHDTGRQFQAITTQLPVVYRRAHGHCLRDICDMHITDMPT